MGHRTGTFFQMARGRAMVRTKSMNAARRLSRLRARVTAAPTEADAYLLGRTVLPYHYGLSREVIVRTLGDHIRTAVDRARRANRDWRNYRATARELGEID